MIPANPTYCSEMHRKLIDYDGSEVVVTTAPNEVAHEAAIEAADTDHRYQDEETSPQIQNFDDGNSN